MDIRQVDNSQYSNRRRSRDYDMMPSLWRAMPWPGTDLQISPGVRLYSLQLQRAGGAKPGSG